MDSEEKNREGPAFEETLPDERLTTHVTTLKGGRLATGVEVFGGRFRLEKPLGRGGFGEVWRAHDTTLDHTVAMKFLPDEVRLDADALRGFRLETKKSIGLTHPHIVRVHYLLEDDEAVGIAMECVNGKTLSGMKADREKKFFEVEEIRTWIEQVGDALEYAHMKTNVVHRDVKPQNVMVDEKGEAKVCDFGISRTLVDSMSRLSQAPKGFTPAYSSPEQAMGAMPDVRQDVYALAATIYDLLTGHPPFFQGDVIWQVLNAEAPRMADRREMLWGEDVGDEIPEAWEETVAACLAKDPAKRPPSVANVIVRLLDTPGLAMAVNPETGVTEAAAEAAAVYAAKESINRVPPPKTPPRTQVPGTEERKVETGQGGRKGPGGTKARERTRPLTAWRIRGWFSKREMGIWVTVGMAGIGGILAVGWGLGWFGDGVRSRAMPDSGPGSETPNQVPTAREEPFVNSLGMKFLPVPITGGETDGKRVLFSVWEARVQDYAAFAAANPETNSEWMNFEEEGHAQEPDHPVIMVSLEDANAFCEWLTEKEREEGRIGADDMYRLPTDHEWSCAVGIGDREDVNVTPESKGGVLEDYPWQTAWPPPEGSGNYADKTHADSFGFGMEDYDDGFAYTSPVGSFAANTLGIHDLGGNVWEWCEGTWDGADSKDHLLRGASWRDVDVDNIRSAARRVYGSPDFRFSRFGFRCVIERGGVVATKESPFVNTLGMQFVPVPITERTAEEVRVLFSVWETRVQDFRAFVDGDSSYRYGDGEDPYFLTSSGWEQDGGHGWDEPGFAQIETTAVTCVSWDDATAFCLWLTKTERRKGRIGTKDSYRLPTDHEWSCAVGIGGLERANLSPKEKDSKIENNYPWGTTFPPPAGTGNYAGSEVKTSPWPGGYATIESFEDGYPRTAPVGSFGPNGLGLFDLSGNLWEWCDGWFDPNRQKGRVLRGGSWLKGTELYLRSSFRYQFESGKRYGGFGFRCVLELGGS